MVKTNKDYNCKGFKWAFACWSEGVFFFRVFGYGLHFKDFRKGVLFSQRNFILINKPVLVVGYWFIKILKPK